MKYGLMVFAMIAMLLVAVFAPAFASDDEAVMVELLNQEDAITYLMSGSIEADEVTIRFAMSNETGVHRYRFETNTGTVHFSSSVTFPADRPVDRISATAISNGVERDLTVLLMSSVSSTPAPTRIAPTPPAPTATVQPTLTPFVPTPTNTATPEPTATATTVQPTPAATVTLLPLPLPTTRPAPDLFYTFLPIVVADHHSGE